MVSVVHRNKVKNYCSALQKSADRG